MIGRELTDFLIVSGCNAAISAGKEIMKLYNSSEEFDVAMNSNNTIVTKADRVAHEAIKRSLSPTRTPIMSEEGRNILYEERYSWDLYWLVDPLDGTREFIKRNNEFAISIALMSNNIPLFGVIFIPSDDKLYFSDPDRGAFIVANCREINSFINTSSLFSKAKKIKAKIKEERDENESVNIVITRSHLNNETEDIINSLRNRFTNIEVKNCGSSKKLCMIAEGSADIYFRTTPLFDWDIAAGQAIAKAAGVELKTLTNHEVQYNKKELIIEPFYLSTMGELNF